MDIGDKSYLLMNLPNEAEVSPSEMTSQHIAYYALGALEYLLPGRKHPKLCCEDPQVLIVRIGCEEIRVRKTIGPSSQQWYSSSPGSQLSKPFEIVALVVNATMAYHLDNFIRVHYDCVS